MASLARDPNRFLSAVQIGVTVAGFFSAAFGASTLAPSFAPAFDRLGAPAPETVSLVVTTLVVSYLSLVLGELVPKRLALQRSEGVARLFAPPLGRFATVMKPVIWLLSISTNAMVRLLGGNPDAAGDEVDEEELRMMISGHEDIPEGERRLVDEHADADAERRTRSSCLVAFCSVVHRVADGPREHALRCLGCAVNVMTPRLLRTNTPSFVTTAFTFSWSPESQSPGLTTLNARG